MRNQKYVKVGIIDGKPKILGSLNGNFQVDGFGLLSGIFSVEAREGDIELFDANHHRISCFSSIRLIPKRGSTFTIFNIPIGKGFHWETEKDLTFEGELFFFIKNLNSIYAINKIPIEDYLRSVITSEMSASLPVEFLKTHAVLSRSWLLKILSREKKEVSEGIFREEEILRWYDREEHDLYDVCCDDHCQRYHGIKGIEFREITKAVEETSGMVLTYKDEICDIRYSKACGGITERFNTAWDDRRIPYLEGIPDSFIHYPSVIEEEDAKRWILSEPEAYCNVRDEDILHKILTEIDRETKDFFRWKIEYPREELEDILKEKSGIDFGTLYEIIPLDRGPSGRISRLKIEGSKRVMVVGKELEIRRLLSRTHLKSSAFVVEKVYNSYEEVERFIFHGAGWGHGVGLCQIGASVMALKGFSMEKILKHYFPETEIKKIY